MKISGRVGETLIVVAVYILAHLASWCAGRAATPFVHDLAFAYPAILVGLLIGSVGVYLTSVRPTIDAIERRGDLSDAIRNVRRTTRHLRENVIFAVYLVGLQGAVELVRLLDIPGVVWPFSGPVFAKVVFLNALGITAAALEIVVVIDCVRAMFTLTDVNDEASDPL